MKQAVEEAITAQPERDNMARKHEITMFTPCTVIHIYMFNFSG